MAPLRLVVLHLSFTAAIVGSFYVLMTGSLIVHECAHCAAGACFGARSFGIAVSPGFAGWAASDHPSTPEAERAVQYAGIAVNACIGLCAFAVLRFRRPRLSPRAMVLFWIAVTQSGHAVGYTFQGLAFGQGDAGELSGMSSSFVEHALAVACCGAFVVLARGALLTLAAFAREHFGAATTGRSILSLILSVTIPLGAVVAAAPGLPTRALWTRVAFEGTVLLILGIGSVWAAAATARPDGDSQPRPLSGAVASCWFVAAMATFLATEFWLHAGVHFSL